MNGCHAEKGFLYSFPSEVSVQRIEQDKRKEPIRLAGSPYSILEMGQPATGIEFFRSHLDQGDCRVKQ